MSAHASRQEFGNRAGGGRKRGGVLAAALLALVLPASAQANSVAEFYRGRTLSILVGYEAGSGYTILARVIARYLGKYIPGHPTVVVQTMPGAGSRKATSFLYNAAPKDGSMIGSIGRTMPLVPLLSPGSANFDALKFNWLGSASKNVMVGVSWHASPVKSFEDARRHELIVGAPSMSSEAAQIPKLYNATMGTRFKVIAGYPQPQIVLAMERGELQGHMQWSIDALLAQQKQLIDEKKINLLVQTGFKRDARLPHIPLAIDFTRTPADRQLIKLIFTAYEIARPYLAPPGVSADRVQALRAGFAQLMRDREFLAAAAKARIDVVDPASAGEVLALIHEMYAQPATVIERARRVIGSN